MIKNLFYVLGLLLFTSAASFSQKNSISGIVVDKTSGDAIPFASIAVKLENNLLSTGSISNEDGTFTIEKLSAGNYSLIVSFIGYEAQTINNIVLTTATSQTNVGNIKISPSNIALNQVDVTANANTMVNKIDRKTYRAQDFATAKGGTATDLLNKLPAVSVSPDGEVSVRGTTDFMVYLNGKPTQMEPSMLLAQISGDAIESIDVISVPTAKYDAQGKGGIINITTKTSGLQGLSIVANGNLGGSPWNNKTDTYSGYHLKDDRYNGSLNFLYGKDNFSAYGGLSYSYKNVNGKRWGEARILDTETGAYKHMLADGERPEWYEYYSANAGFDYSLSKNTKLSGSYFFGNRTEGRSAFYIYNNFYADKNKNTIEGIDKNEEWIYNPNTDNRYGIFHTASIDFQHQIDKSSSIKSSFLYEHSNLSRNLDNYNYAYDKNTDAVGNTTLHFNQSDETPLDAYRFTVDYSKEFDNGNRLGLGIQPQIFNINGNFNFNVLDVETNTDKGYTDLENGIDLSRGIYAGYIDYAGTAGQLKYMAGLRLEYTDQELNIENPNYFTIFDRATESTYQVNKLDWFPTLHASYPLGETNKLSLAASRRISRPPIKNMAPFLYRRHLEVYVVGDPALKPEYTNNIELDLETTFGKQKVNITGFYRGVDNAIFRVNTVYTEEMVLIRSYTNSGNSNAMGMELNANLDAGKKLKFFVGGSLYNYRVQGTIFGFDVDNQSTNWSLKGSANWAISNELKLSADFDVKSATVTAQGQNDMFYMTNAALSYSPAKLKSWNFNLRVLDLVQSNLKGLDTNVYNTANQQIFYQETLYTRSGPIVELGLSYAFNNKGKSNKKAESSFGKSEF